jgi:Family of unknown function (DUF6535)
MLYYTSRLLPVAARVGPLLEPSQPTQIRICMADQERRARDLNADYNVSNLGLPQTRAPHRRRKEVVEIRAGEGGLLPGMTKEYTAWDVYNNEARKVDTELVNDWRDSLNSLLLFVSIPTIDP